MTGNTRQRRIDTLSQAARRKSETKTKAAEAAIRALVKHGEPVTFQAVQREAGVSHAFLYGNADLRARIERLRDQTRPKPPPPAEITSDNTIIQALTSQITHLKKQHRDEIQALQAPHSSRPTAKTWSCGANLPASAGIRSPQRRSNVISITTTI
jgi:hypothetical protein